MLRSRPETVEGGAALVRAARERGVPVKAVGSGHSFTPIAATDGIQVDLSALSGIRRIEPDPGEPGGALVTFGAGTRLYEIAPLLAPHGLALQN
ncbi:FAD-binding protein, partial [Mesorhizobium japonicum]|uniref:FAD-binding protein n=1 Tax=Mesorhizobium japonicum TaxID=2066070 RepID=UPI003B5B2F7B